MRFFNALVRNRRLFATYVQGSRPTNPKYGRQYFYHVDEHGQLFLEDTKVKNFITAYKDKAFLNFFYKRLTINTTGMYESFPYVSLCGKEINFLKSGGTSPIVFSEIDAGYLIYGGTLKFEFQPTKLEFSVDGRLFHPSPKPKVCEMALIGSKLAISLSKQMSFEPNEFGDGYAMLDYDGHAYPVRIVELDP
ncbi:hypothetical protein SARC_03165 [Sphaeroforma arctica JP610]|uniref:Uncharacterized protein n=1 Tax=Sphaeroforma arctica JP610 TaxID=667725 RepID=A0A0L0G6J5_9EUKA|nr:hypothetical protein SARC_03165 [Sphaeroforma arctica JP610]KNC84635.1 hypothetical protein SARC_03165 [Sphaeroforma arctica JP610]|eukprot:XP_014158537.1 hypothetical protein SARC_03165 [Sphaeroforma arctica JP610]